MEKSDTSRALELAETDVQITYGELSGSYPCKVSFDLRRNNSLLIVPLSSVHGICPRAVAGGPFLLTIRGAENPVECYAEQCTLRVGGERSGVFVSLAPRFSNIQLDHSTPLVRINAGVLNLGHYQFARPMGLSIFTLSHDSWIFEFTPLTESTVLYPPSVQDETSEYFFTHHMCAHKVDYAPFACSEAHDQLRHLATFLSFCHGHWVSTALTYGLNEQGTVAMEEWGTHQVSPWRRTTNWLDEHHGGGMVELFPGFSRRMADPEWKDALEHAIYWYTRSDASLVGPDGASILLQAVLERLAWQLLVRERRSLSKDGFSKLPAADQLRLLLAALSIPLSLPPGLIELQNTARQFNWADGPQAFVEVRNRLVHPPKKGRKDQKLPYYDTFLLGKWYVELAVLSACGYTGLYGNRTNRQRAIGEVEPVPWAQGSMPHV